MNNFELLSVFEGEDSEVNALKEINLSKALLEDNQKKLFQLSGLREIYKIILKDIEPVADIKYLFIENSTFSSAIGSNRLDAFTCVMDADNGQFRKNIETYLRPVIATLQKEHHALLLHPDFCKSPSTAKAFVSVLPISEITFSGDIDGAEKKYENLTADEDNDRVALKKVEEEEFKNDGVYACNSNINIPYDNLKTESIETGRTNSPEKLHKLDHAVYNKYFLKGLPALDPNKFQSVFLSIPVLSSSGGLDEEDIGTDNRTRFKGHGALFVFFVLKKKSTITENSGHNFQSAFAGLALKLPRLVKTITFDYVFKIGLEKARRAKNEAIKSAKAAIMARNMSHNIGSHVISYLNAHLSNVEAVLDIGAFNDIVKRSKDAADGTIKLYFADKEGKGEFDNQKVQLPFLLGLGKFLGYLQERQDFIASIATDHIPPSSGVNLKDFVLDGFAWDSRQKRHGKEVTQYSNILLEYIAKSEGITREKLKIFFNEQDLDIPILADNSSVRGVNVALPGGIMGRQALYSVFENIIRNSAKHAKSKPEFHLHINVGDFNKFENYEFFKLSNNKNPVEKRSLQKISFSEFTGFEDNYYSLIIRDHFGNASANTLLNVLAGVEKEMINDDYSLNEQAKGLKEMRISAAWIRGKSVTDEKDEKFPFLMAGRLNVTKEAALSNIIRESQLEREKLDDPDIIQVIEEKISLLKQQLAAFDSSQRAEIVEQHLAFHILLPKSFKAIIISDKINDDIRKLLILHDWQVLSSKEISKVQNLYANMYILDSDVKENVLDLIYSFGNKVVEESEEKLLRKFRPGSFKTDLFSKRMIEAKITPNSIEGFHLEAGETLPAKIHELFIYLYKKIISENFKVSMNQVLINIDDDKDKQANVKPSTVLSEELINYPGKLNPTIGTFSHRINFRKHFELKHIALFQNQNKDGFDYVESITGDNSTNRLMRSEAKDDTWVLKMVEAALSKVLIIDERIWDDIVIPERNKESKVADDKVKLLRAKHIYVGNLFIHDEIDEHTKLVKKHKRTGLVKKIAKIYSVDSATNMVQDFLNITINDDGETDSLDINPAEGADTKFTFLLIHQGLLDKIFTHLRPDYYENISDLSAFFAETKLIVHSGRSRPSKEQLPHWIPFLSFSSIRSLLDDSKYSFSEQLYAAHPLLVK